jgi:hypothetical protein
MELSPLEYHSKGVPQSGLSSKINESKNNMVDDRIRKCKCEKWFLIMKLNIGKTRFLQKQVFTPDQTCPPAS